MKTGVYTKHFHVLGYVPRCCKRFCLALMKAKMSASARMSPVNLTDPEPELTSLAELKRVKKTVKLSKNA